MSPCACRVVRDIAPAVYEASECMAPESAVIATSTPVAEYVAPAPAVTYLAPAPADCAAPAPAVKQAALETLVVEPKAVTAV